MAEKTAIHLDRTAITLILGLALTVGLGFTRYTEDSGLAEERFWLTKVNWQNAAPTIIAGDSRAYIGLSPDHISKHIGSEVRNFGFNACNYNDEYLDAIENALDSSIAKPRVILAVTPLSLLPKMDNNFFFSYRAHNRDMRFIDRQSIELRAFFDPMLPKLMVRKFFPEQVKEHVWREFFANGWCAITRDPTKPGSDVRNYRNIVFKDKRVSPELTEAFLKVIRNWTKKGIKVYGLRPPTCAEMLAVEKEMSGFQQEEFVRRFEDAGGIWLEIDQLAYETFDDSHLQRASAVALSEKVGTLIRAHEQGQ